MLLYCTDQQIDDLIEEFESILKKPFREFTPQELSDLIDGKNDENKSLMVSHCRGTA